jgi:proline racemase
MTAEPLAIETIDHDTDDEPFRIIVGGVPPLQGSTILERRRFARRCRRCPPIS